MIRSALLLCAGIIAATCFACAPLPPPAPPPAAVEMAKVSTTATPQPTCDADFFLSKVQVYMAKFTPGPGAYLPPSIPLLGSPGGPQKAVDLTAAFNAAPPNFRQQLCNLDMVYINAGPCTLFHECLAGSWGWRQSRNKYGDGRIVALSAGLWREARYRDSYAHFETELTQSLLPAAHPGWGGPSSVTYSNVQSCPAGVCRPINEMAMVLLAALAHEMGHIRYQELVDATNPQGYCSGNFYGDTWEDPTSPMINGRHGIRPPPNWRSFLTSSERVRLRGGPDLPNGHRLPPHFKDIDNPGNADVASLVYGLFDQKQPWASLFGAVSPDEDFVETYKLKVLTTADPPLTSAPINVRGFPPANIVADYVAGNKLALKTKTACIPDTF
jgi:hypothetical protein